MDIFIFLSCKPYTPFSGQFSHLLFYSVFSYHTLLDTVFFFFISVPIVTVAMWSYPVQGGDGVFG